MLAALQGTVKALWPDGYSIVPFLLSLGSCAAHAMSQLLSIAYWLLIFPLEVTQGCTDLESIWRRGPVTAAGRQLQGWDGGEVASGWSIPG